MAARKSKARATATRVVEKAKSIVEPSIIPEVRKERRAAQREIIKHKLRNEPFRRTLRIFEDANITGDGAVDALRANLVDIKVPIDDDARLDAVLAEHMEQVEKQFGRFRR